MVCALPPFAASPPAPGSPLPPPQATKLLKASILKVDVGDLELDEDELAADMAAHAGEGRWGGG